MTRLLVPLITLGLFIWLADFAWHKHPPVYRPVVAAAPHVDFGIAFRTPPDCGLDWLCLRTWAEGKQPKDATPEDLAALIERSNREAKRHHALSGSDEQAVMAKLWGPE